MEEAVEPVYRECFNKENCTKNHAYWNDRVGCQGSSQSSLEIVLWVFWGDGAGGYVCSGEIILGLFQET